MTTTEYNLDTHDKIVNILEKCYRITTETPAMAFFEWSPHVNAVYVKIYQNGYSVGAGFGYYEMAYYAPPTPYSTSIPGKTIEELDKELSEILKNGGKINGTA